MTQVPAPTSPPAAPGAFAALRRRYARLSPDMRRRLPALALTRPRTVVILFGPPGAGKGGGKKEAGEDTVDLAE